jgi:hypothetical protein
MSNKIKTVKAILRRSEKEDLDDEEFVLCHDVLCAECPAYQLGDETPTHKCKLRWFRDWYWDNVLNVGKGYVRTGEHQ